MTRKRISKATALVIGLIACVVIYVISPEEFGIPYLAQAIIALAVLGVLFEDKRMQEKPDVDPAERVRRPDEQRAD